MITLSYAERHEVVGRNREIAAIADQIANPRTKAVLLHGDSGVGKTAIANRIVTMVRLGGLSRPFMTTHLHSCFQESWSSLLAQIAGRLVGREVILKATASELEDQILRVCRETSVLLAIDNVEPALRTEASNFTQKWIDASHDSVLLITSIKEIQTRSPRAFSCLITGLRDVYPQLELVGSRLRDRFGDDVLLRHLGGLDGVPLNLLYLRWLDPRGQDELRSTVDNIGAGRLDQAYPLGDLLPTITEAPVHFMALGLVRRLQFDEQLLAFLWSHLGGGNTAAYVTNRERLVASRLLVPVQGQPRPTYRIPEEVHKHLNRALVPMIGGEQRLPAIHFIASEYYRRAFEQSDRRALDALGGFVYHCFAGGEHMRAYRYVFESDRLLSTVHQRGMAVELQDVMETFMTEEAARRFDPVQRSRVLIALAHVASDLSQFERCLDLTVQAEDVLRSAWDEVPEPQGTDLLKQVWYYSAVSFSNTGRSDDCSRSYYKVVASAAPTGTDPLACLSLGYLAHNIKYRDVQHATLLGRIAVDLARETGDPLLLAKNLCSVAESYMYARRSPESEACFREAYALCTSEAVGGSAQRELGRVLMNWGVLALAEGRWDLSMERLSEGHDLSKLAGDRRRVATAVLYSGIVDYRCARREVGLQKARSAIEMLHGLGDGRYLVPAVMTYAWWMDHGYSGQLHDLPLCGGCEPIADIIAAVVGEDRFELFARFWRQEFKGTLL